MEAEHTQGVQQKEEAGHIEEGFQVRRDVGQQQTDRVLQVTSDLCLHSQEEACILECTSSFRQTLSQSVQYWEGVWSVVEKSSRPMSELFSKPSAMLEGMYLTALVAATHCLVSRRWGWWVWS